MMTYTILEISLFCKKCENWQVSLHVEKEPNPFTIMTILHPHATYMATGVVTRGPKDWKGRILVLKGEKTNNPINNWGVNDTLIDAFPQP